MPGRTVSAFTHEESVAAVLAHFEAAVDAEHDRMVADPVARVSLEVHEQFLRRFVRPGLRVLEVGAGTGRFTQTLLDIGARVVVTDLSPAQLAANRSHVSALPGAELVESWQVADVCDLAGFPDGGFDAALAYGGPLSYTFDDLRPVQRPGTGAHTCRMFRADQLRDLLAAVGAQVHAMSASTWTAPGHAELLAGLERDPVAWARYLRREVEACASPGAVDGGTHLLAAFTHGSATT